MRTESKDTQEQALLSSSTSSGQNGSYGATVPQHNDDSHSQSSSLFENGLLEEEKELPVLDMICILSTSFSYGCIMTTLFLITLPVECKRIEQQHPNIPKSVSLGVFVAVAGLTQLISPLVGMLSDTYRPPSYFELGQRMPYLVVGSTCSVIGLLGQYVESYSKLWVRYGVFFFLHMIGLNITYGMMIALIPDQVPHSQIGVANGILAFMLVTGSLFGFGLFHVFFQKSIQDMYGLYTCIVIVATILTGTYAHDRDASITAHRRFLSQRGEDTRPRHGILTPWVLIRTLLYDPIRQLDARTLFESYTIDIEKHHDFFVVTVSRLFYYCGISVQTFFLYFIHDIINVRDDPESAVAYLAILGQVSGSFTCYPVGVISDRFCGGRRKPFIYVACTILGCLTTVMIFARTMDQMIVLYLILGVANGIYLTMETSLAVDTLSRGYEDGPSGGHAQLLGIWGVAAFLGSALGPMIGGPLLYVFGHTSGDDDDQPYLLRGYAVILILSTFYFAFSAISLRWVKNQSV